jgi:hypothetical protein
MMHESEKSDPAIVAATPANNVGRSEAEPAERREGAKGTRTRPARAGHRAGIVCFRDLNVHEREQGRRTRISSPLCFTV